MKQNFTTIFILTIVAFFIYSCQPQSDEIPEQFEAEVDEVVNIIAENLLMVSIEGGDENQAFSSGRILGDQDSYMSSSSQAKEKDPIPMISCLQSLKLDHSQLQDIRRLLFVFENCKSNIMLAYREEISKIMVSLEGRRSGLLENLREGKISREEYKNQIEDLRKRYRFIMDELKESYKEELRPCLKVYVANLQIILGREDWLKFRKCISND